MKKVVKYGHIKQPVQTPIQEVRCEQCGAVFKSNEFTNERFDEVGSVLWIATVCPVCKKEVIMYAQRG